jgi:hypothetical protein
MVSGIPKPDPVSGHTDDVRPDYDAAIERGSWAEAVNLVVQAIFRTAIAICQDSGIPAPRPANTTFVDVCDAFCGACENHLATAEYDYRVDTARHVFEVLASVHTTLAQGVGVLPPGEIVGRLLILGATLGHADVMLTLVTTGIWAEYADVLTKHHPIGQHLRGREPVWETGFLPFAVAYCETRSHVTVGALRREAERWAASERAAGRNPGLPGTEKGINDGIKRLEKSGKLKIPGRPSGGN